MAYFAFMEHPGQEFVFELKDQHKIDKARKIVSGEEQDEVHVHGRIIKRQQPYNLDWSYHLDPSTIDFFQMAIEVCDANMSYVEEHLDEAGGAFLPGAHWCPWDSRVIKEVEFS
jgi:tRNA/tmRNA/rRNA uracil-C5-methylase (TrmA/RlmC/RlmD family)